MAILRKPPTASRQEWEEKKPTMHEAQGHMHRVIDCAPHSWRTALKQRFGEALPANMHRALTDREFLQQPPEWAQAWNLLQAVADYEDDFGAALRWNLDDVEICGMAKRLAAQAEELEAADRALGATDAQCVDSIRMLVRAVGVAENRPIEGVPAIKRAQDAAWWRRLLRVHVARLVEGAHVRQAMVHKGSGAYVSEMGLARRAEQKERNAASLARTVFKNEAGQYWRLDELAKLGVSNPIVRGDELMTRIRGAEEYADSRAHVGEFLTLTLPSRFHAVKLGSGGRPFPNPKYDASLLPRDGQLWLRKAWARVRSQLTRDGIKFYGLRVAEPHHDATPHWHMLLWVEGEAQAQRLKEVVLHHWLRDDGDERGARENRVNFKRMLCGGAAGYVAKYITKSVGQLALVEHKDVVDGLQVTMDFGPTDPDELREVTQGHVRVESWASTWGIRQFQAFGMPSVSIWRELRRVTPDQLELFTREGDKATTGAFAACHRHGAIKACWRRFMEHMGGHCRARRDWHMRLFKRENFDEIPNRYGEVLPFVKVVGLRVQMGRMHGQVLISRRMDWFPVVGDEASETLAQMQQCADEGVPFRQALPAAWTRFNNCTARLGNDLVKEITGTTGYLEHHASDWLTPETVAHFKALRAWEAMQ